MNTLTRLLTYTLVMLVALCLAGPSRGFAHARGGVGTWTPLANLPDVSLGICILVPDGTVMCQEANGSSQWRRLTPDGNGRYVNGTWTTMPSITDSRDLYASQVLRDGRVWVGGGEFGFGESFQIYQPRDDTWTEVPTPGFNAYGQSKQLPNGNLLLSPIDAGPGCFPNYCTFIFDIVTNTLTRTPNPGGTF